MMFLFQGAFGTVLHTGDCRLTEDQHGPIEAIREALIRRGIVQIDVVYLDCTFGAFPKARVKYYTPLFLMDPASASVSCALVLNLY